MPPADTNTPSKGQPSLGALAYLYFYPLVENLRQVRRYVETGVGSNPAAPWNTFSHARKLAGPEDTFVTINNDTAYSMAQLDLSVGPLRLEVPEAKGRYYVLQFVDAWTNNIAYVGSGSPASSWPSERNDPTDELHLTCRAAVHETAAAAGRVRRDRVRGVRPARDRGRQRHRHLRVQQRRRAGVDRSAGRGVRRRGSRRRGRRLRSLARR